MRRLPFICIICLIVPALLSRASTTLAGAGAEELKRTLGIEMVRIPGGEFQMGSNDIGDDLKPVHRVRVSDFFIGKTEVTQKQWVAVMGSNPSYFQGCDDCPVEQVSWDDAQAFILKLNQQAGTSFRLPTEAEWEYAAGGGSRHRKWAGTDSERELGEYAWYFNNSAGRTHPVGQKKPNEYGLYDMSGNVWEWCADWKSNYSSEDQDNPTGPPAGTDHVRRGGSWGVYPRFAGVACREGNQPGDLYNNLGFRLALPAGR